MDTSNTPDPAHATGKKAEKSGERLADGQFQPGHRLGGRPKGSGGMSAAKLRETVLDAFEELGGAAWLVSVTHENPERMIRLLGQLLPRRTEIDLAETQAGRVRVNWRDLASMTDAELADAANAGLLAEPPREDEP